MTHHMEKTAAVVQSAQTHKDIFQKWKKLKLKDWGEKKHFYWYLSWAPYADMKL